MADDEWIDDVVVEYNITIYTGEMPAPQRLDRPSRAMCYRTAHSNNYTSYTTYKLSWAPILYVSACKIVSFSSSFVVE